MINSAIQKSINTLDALRIKTTEAEIEGWASAEALEKRMLRSYDSVASVAKRQGFSVLTGEEYLSKTEVDVDALNDLLSRLK